MHYIISHTVIGITNLKVAVSGSGIAKAKMCIDNIVFYYLYYYHSLYYLPFIIHKSLHKIEKGCFLNKKI